MLTHEIVEKVRAELLGTGNTVASLEDEFQMDEMDLLDFVILAEIERCDVCDWWCNAWELDEDLVCRDCANTYHLE